MPNTAYDAARELLTIDTCPETLEAVATKIPSSVDAMSEAVKRGNTQLAQVVAERFKPSEREIEKLGLIFKAVQSHKGWKWASVAMVPSETVGDIARAVEWFAGSPLYAMDLSGGSSLIYFPGYYRCVGA